MSKDEQLYKDIGDIKECLLGDPYDPESGLVKNVHAMKKQQCVMQKQQGTMQDQQCLMQNQIHTLIQAEEKRIEAEKNKITLGKLLKKVASVFLTAKTGI